MSIQNHVCSIPECGRNGRRRDQETGTRFCDGHFRRLKEYGDPLQGGTVKWGRQRTIMPGQECSKTGCASDAYCKGACKTHYMAARRHRMAEQSSAVS